jgi:hypothetical protein
MDRTRKLTTRRLTGRLGFLPTTLPVLAALLGLAACETGTPTLPAIPSAQISVSIDPSPIEASQNDATKAVTARFDVKLEELAGLGGDVVSVNAAAFDPATGAQVALVYFDDADLVVFVGSKRLEALGTLVVPETLSYLLTDGSKETNAVVTVQVRDDRQNLLTRSVMAKIQ